MREKPYLVTKLNRSSSKRMAISNLEKSHRAAIVAQALKNLRAHGVAPPAEVLALYAQYVGGNVSWEQVRDLLDQRREALRAARLYQNSTTRNSSGCSEQ